MLKTLTTFGLFAAMIGSASFAHAQALPTAVSHGELQIGGGWSYAEPDYGQKAIQGATIFGDFDFSPHIGAEAEYHYISMVTPTDLGENSIFIGPRFVLPHNRINLYAKLLFGIGDIAIQEVEDNPQGGAGKYLAYGAGIGVDYRVTHHLVTRADFEYQHWTYLNGLTPTVFTVGVAYRFR